MEIQHIIALVIGGIAAIAFAIVMRRVDKKISNGQSNQTQQNNEENNSKK